jgi:FKBP-type peptidyl-prolyl cis-trans isomerase (trigger factor)
LRDKTLAGKKAVFDVTIVEASKRTLPDLTDEFANKVRAGLTVENLKEELRKAVDNEDAKEFTPARNAVLASSLSAVLDVEVPDSLVTNQAREKFALMMTDMRNNGVSDEEVKKQIQPENFLKYKKIVRADIVRDFKVSMATDEIARMENIEVPDYQVEEQMEAIRKDAAESNEQFDETLIRGKVEATLQRSAVMDFLAENGDLKVEYTDDGEKFDEALLEKIAKESIEREEEMSASEQGESAATLIPVVDAVVEEPKKEEPVVAKAEPTPEPKKEAAAESAAPEERDYSSMTLEEKAYYALKDSGALDDSADA